MLVFAGTILHRLISPEGLRRAALLTLLLLVGAAIAFQAVENGHHPEPISLWDGLWWATETVTTVGYGDIYPVTDAGRVIAIVVMLSGIGFVALLTGSIAQQFFAASPEQAREDGRSCTCGRCPRGSSGSRDATASRARRPAAPRRARLTAQSR